MDNNSNKTEGTFQPCRILARDRVTEKILVDGSEGRRSAAFARLACWRLALTAEAAWRRVFDRLLAVPSAIGVLLRRRSAGGAQHCGGAAPVQRCEEVVLREQQKQKLRGVALG